MDVFTNYSSESDLFSPGSNPNDSARDKEICNPAVPARTVHLVVVVLTLMWLMKGGGLPCFVLKSA
jgi:hypothetical protein